MEFFLKKVQFRSQIVEDSQKIIKMVQNSWHGVWQRCWATWGKTQPTAKSPRETEQTRLLRVLRAPSTWLAFGRHLGNHKALRGICPIFSPLLPAQQNRKFQLYGAVWGSFPLSPSCWSMYDSHWTHTEVSPSFNVQSLKIGLFVCRSNRGEETKTQRDLLPAGHSPAGQSLTRWKMGARSSIRASHLTGRDPGTCAILCCFARSTTPGSETVGKSTSAHRGCRQWRQQLYLLRHKLSTI